MVRLRKRLVGEEEFEAARKAEEDDVAQGFANGAYHWSPAPTARRTIVLDILRGTRNSRGGRGDGVRRAPGKKAAARRRGMVEKEKEDGLGEGAEDEGRDAGAQETVRSGRGSRSPGRILGGRGRRAGEMVLFLGP